MRTNVTRYRVMGYVTGTVLIVLCLLAVHALSPCAADPKTAADPAHATAQPHHPAAVPTLAGIRAERTDRIGLRAGVRSLTSGPRGEGR